MRDEDRFRVIPGGRPDPPAKARPTLKDAVELLAEMHERCDGEPHCCSCVFCGSTVRGEHADGCPWPRVRDMVKT
jgi:hypothetical protein